MNLNYKSFGHGPALVILHGLFGSLDNWLSHARQLADTYSVFIVDQRNHGKSPHDPQMNYSLMAEDLHAFLDQHGIFRTHLLGHSMGGKTVMQFAGMYPERIEKLIVADMAPKAYPPHHSEILQAMDSLNFQTLQSRQEAETQLAKRISEPSVRQFLLKSLARDSDSGWNWKFNLEAIRNHYEEILAAIKTDVPFDGPTLFLTGEKSSYVTLADQPLIREAFPEAEFVVIPGAGHWLHAEKPEAFLQAVRGFLEV